VAAGKGPNGGGRNRGLFDVDVNYTVGWNDAGDWQNYTRTFPTPAKKYSVYGFASSGGSPIQFTLDEVTAGVGTEAQTLKPLADLKPGRATAGWDNLELFQFTNPGTQVPAVLELGGKKTLRITLPAGNGDIDYIAFIPAADEVHQHCSQRQRLADPHLDRWWQAAVRCQPQGSVDRRRWSSQPVDAHSQCRCAVRADH